MNHEPIPAVLRRYTDIPGLLHVLTYKALTLLDPSSWDDKNDSYNILKYKEKDKNLKAVLALCFTKAEETYHHWRVFAPGPSGVCIVFHGELLISTLSIHPGIVCRSVEYHQVRELKRGDLQPKVADLPFVKRFGFGPEEEYRVLYTSGENERAFLQVPISYDCIKEIRLSPWLNTQLKGCVRDAINNVTRPNVLKVSRSSLIGNSTWKRFGDRAT
jgi:hypothetical protein